MDALEMDRQEARDRRESLAYALPRLDATREALVAQIARTEKHYGTCRYTQWPASSYHAVTTLEADVQAAGGCRGVAPRRGLEGCREGLDGMTLETGRRYGR